MEKEAEVDKIQEKSIPFSFPPFPGVSGSWGPLPCPSRERPLPPALSLCSPSTLPSSSAVHTLQTKVRTITQRRQRGRERTRDRVDAEVQLNQPAVQTLPEVSAKQRALGNGKVSLPIPAWQCRPLQKSSTSEDEDEEVEVRVRLEIHSPPAEAGEGQVSAGEMGKERSDAQASSPPSQPRGMGEGASLENLVSDNSSNGKDDQSPPPPPPTPTPLPPSALSASLPLSSTSTVPASSSSSSSSRHWAPPKGFWRVARPETLLLNGVGPHNMPSSLPVKDYTQKAAQARGGPSQRRHKLTEAGVGSAVDDSDNPLEFKHSDSLECYLDKYEQKEAESVGAVQGRLRTGSCDSVLSHSELSSIKERLEVKQRVYGRSKDRRRGSNSKEREQGDRESDTCSEKYRVGGNGGYESLDNDSDSTGVDSSVSQDYEPSSISLFSAFTDDLPLSPRHEQAKRLLERARLKARSNHIKCERPPRRAHSDQRGNNKRQQDAPAAQAPQHQPAVQPAKDEPRAPPTSGPFLVPEDRCSSLGDQGGRTRRYGCSPTRVRFEDESEKEAESRYLDRLRERGRPATSSGRTKGQRSISVPALQRKEDVGAGGDSATVIKEIIVVVKKCEACGSVVREPPSDPQLQQPSEDVRGKPVPRWVPPNKPEASTRPKTPLTVTFAGAFVLGENKESGTGWRTSGFGKLRRRSRKGESRLESGHGPYGPSWAQRRNSNPRTRASVSRAVSFAPGSPITLEPRSVEASGDGRASPMPPVPIKSALKSSSKNRFSAGQSSAQCQMGSNQAGGDAGTQDSPDSRREGSMSFSQGTPTTTSLAPCIRPSTLRYSPARITTDLSPVKLWDETPDGTAGVTLSGDPGSGLEGRPGPRSLFLARAEDLRAELLRAEHLKAEAMWDDNSDVSRKSMAERDGRPKLSLRRFFSSIGLNSVGRLVKGSRSSSMEQLTIPASPRASSASASPTRRPQPGIRLQRTPSLQSLHTVLPLAQLRKASSVQSLERRTERSTILGEVQIPYGLAPSPESLQVELHGALGVDDMLASRMVRPIGRVTQAFPDGTLLLELTRPPNGPFGFLISRGKGRPDTGVYIEKVGDGAGEGPYVGLLGVGDEILQVNGEAVAGLSLDQITRLMTKDSTASVRIVPFRRGQR